MLQTKHGSSPVNYPSKIFLGVRFVLLGFDPINKPKVLSKLVDGGGVYVGQYGPNCTHVIVDKLVYDDPVCVAARNDGKTLVTALWVAHSLDLGILVDHLSIMYRPLKDVKGIPGAKSITACLTGYQRHDRDDIMTMVGLMGANFSKPLVANKVTHLICYKFEGEKYELAKKMKRIKLINHRWLNDCLNAWEILPEENYDKSGFELEMLEAEAKDSEEEAGAVAPKQHGEEVASHPHQISEQEILMNPLDSSASKGLSNVGNANDQADVSVGETFNPYGIMKTPTRVANDLASTSKTAKRSPLFDTTKFGHTSCFRKTPPSVFPGEMAKILSAGKFNVSAGFDISSPVIEQDKVAIDFSRVTTPVKGTELPSEGDKSGILPEKRKTDVSCGSSKLPKTDDNPKEYMVVNKTKLFEPTSESNVRVEIKNHLSSSAVNPAQMFEEALETSLSGLKKANLGINSDTRDVDMNKGEHAICESREPVNEMQDIEISSDINKTIEKEKSNSFANLDLVKGGNADEQSKPARRKTLGKRNSGPKQSFGKGNTTNQKGSIYLNKTASQNDDVTCSIGRKVAADHTLVNSEKLETVPPTVNVDMITGKGIDVVPKSGLEVDKKFVFLDDETESPEDKEDNECEPHNTGDNVTEAKSESNITNKTVNDKTEIIEKAAVCGEKVDKSGLNHKKKGIKGKLSKGTKRPLSKIKKNIGSSARKATNSTEAAVEEAKSEENIEKTQAEDKFAFMEDETEFPEDKEKNECKRDNAGDNVIEENDKDGIEQLTEVCEEKTDLGESSHKMNAVKGKASKGTKRPLSKIKKNIVSSVKNVTNSKETADEEDKSEVTNEKIQVEKEESIPHLAGKTKRTVPLRKLETPVEMEKENRPVSSGDENVSHMRVGKVASNKVPRKNDPKAGELKKDSMPVKRVPTIDPVWFILSGHKLQRKEFQQVIRRLRGRVCRDSHNWSYQATHFIVPDPVRRTEKFFAAAASGRWVLKTDYLAASNQAGKFLAEEPYEWHQSGLSEDGTINLEAPRKWRLLRERTGHGAFHGMRIIIYGDCIAPSLDTLKRVVKAGDGTILATSPPYTRFLESGVDFAVVSPGMPRVDVWVQEFLRHEIPCVVADYLVEYVCKPGYPLDKHVQYKTLAWAEKSFKNLMKCSEEIVEDVATPEKDDSDESDIACQVCGSRERGEVMLICGDDSGNCGCGCGEGCHIDCCDPPLEDVPEEDWFCPKCSKGKNGNKTPKKTKKGISVSKRK